MSNRDSRCEPLKHNKERVVWLNVSPSLKLFDQPILKYLTSFVEIAQWRYFQTLDEASSPIQAVALLHDYLQTYNDPIHLVGHGLSGVIALLYARQHPQRVKTLTLLAVSAKPAATWQAHYYVQRQLFPCSQRQILAQTVINLLGKKLPVSIEHLVTAFERDLLEAPSPHSLFQVARIHQSGVTVPTFVCGSQTDPVVTLPALQDWFQWFKPNDRLWTCASGGHFFHYFYPQPVGDELLDFWQISTEVAVNASTLNA